MFGNQFSDEEFNDEIQNAQFRETDTISKTIDAAKKRARSMFRDKCELLKLISYIDLTTLNADDTDVVVEGLIDRAIRPYPADRSVRCAAVCVYPARIRGAKRYVHASQRILPIASVAAGFPTGQYRIESKMLEVKLAIDDGADEIDIVISRDAVLEQNWRRVYDEIASLRSACSIVCMKTILSTFELQNEQNIYRASWAAMLAGTDFIKTSTGKEKVNATLEAAIVMCHAIKQFHSSTGRKVGFKAAGGIRSTLEALEYRAVVEEILGEEWLKPNFFRIGASSLLDDIVKQLDKL